MENNFFRKQPPAAFFKGEYRYFPFLFFTIILLYRQALIKLLECLSINDIFRIKQKVNLSLSQSLRNYNQYHNIMAIEDDIKQPQFKDEYNKLIVNLIFTGYWINEKESEIFKKYQLTAQQYNVLRILRGQYPKPSTINLIIDRMLDRMSNASRIVDRLEKKKLVSRKPSKDDRRAVDVVITQKGLHLLEEIDRELDKWEKSLTNITVKEARTLNRLLDKLRGPE